MKPLLQVWTLAALVLLTGCASQEPLRLYEGDPRPTPEVAVVRVPIELEVMRINGRKIDGLNTLFSPDHRDLHLAPGRYRILAYYKDLWEMSGDNHDVIKTDPALFVVQAKAGHTYELGFDEPQNIEQARELEKKFSGYVLDTNTDKKVATKASGLVFQDGIIGNLGGIAGVQSTQSAAGESTESAHSTVQPLASSNENDTGKSDNAQADTRTDGSQAGGAGASGSGNYLDMLKAYWSQATKDERRAFLQWISEKDRGARREQ